MIDNGCYFFIDMSVIRILLFQGWYDKSSY
jgi:hypothetical protein